MQECSEPRGAAGEQRDREVVPWVAAHLMMLGWLCVAGKGWLVVLLVLMQRGKLGQTHGQPHVCY